MMHCCEQLNTRGNLPNIGLQKNLACAKHSRELKLCCYKYAMKLGLTAVQYKVHFFVNQSDVENQIDQEEETPR
jgi:hypothetical protein